MKENYKNIFGTWSVTTDGDVEVKNGEVTFAEINN